MAPAEACIVLPLFLWRLTVSTQYNTTMSLLTNAVFDVVTQASQHHHKNVSHLVVTSVNASYMRLSRGRGQVRTALKKRETN